MDETARRLAAMDERLERIESQLGTVVTFTGQLQQLFTAWTSGGRGRLVAAAAKLRGAG